MTCGNTGAINLFDHSSQVKKIPAVVMNIYKTVNIFKKKAFSFPKRNIPAIANGYNRSPVNNKIIF